MIALKIAELIRCPFGLNHKIEAKSGKTTCPECSAEFEVDDRLECIFVNIEKVRLPVYGFVCRVCGLVQGDGNGICVYCGTEVSINLQ